MKKILTLILCLLSLTSFAKKKKGKWDLTLDKWEYRLTLTEHPKFQRVTFMGSIAPSLKHKKMKKFIKENISGEKDIVLYLSNALGGHIKGHKRLITRMKKQCYEKRGSECHLTVVVAGYCGSACTFLPLWADDSVMLKGTSLNFHKSHMIHPKLTLQSKQNFIDSYVDIGANRSWFDENIDDLLSKQVKGYAVQNKDSLLDSGIFGRYMKNLREFEAQY